MTIYTVYRVCIWMPILVPIAVILAFTTLGLNLAEGVIAEVLAYSLVFGGVPYAALAAWATWWIGGRPEAQIRRLMFRAPLLMVAVFAPLAALVGVLVRNRGPFIAVALVGSIIILVLGYAYVGLAVLVRAGLGSGSAASRA